MARMIDAPAFLDEETKKEPAVHACETDSPVVAAMAAVHNAMTKLQEAVSGLMDRESNLQIQIESLHRSFPSKRNVKVSEDTAGGAKGLP